MNRDVENTYYLKAVDLAFMIYIKAWLFHPKYISFGSIPLQVNEL